MGLTASEARRREPNFVFNLSRMDIIPEHRGGLGEEYGDLRVLFNPFKMGDCGSTGGSGEDGGSNGGRRGDCGSAGGTKGLKRPVVVGDCSRRNGGSVGGSSSLLGRGRPS